MHRRRFLSLVSGASVVIAGCSGSGGTGNGGDGGGGPAAQEAYPDYSWDKLEDASPTETDTVTLENTAFNPLIASVSSGTEVSFPNMDTFPHTVTIPALDVDDNLDGGQSTLVTFEESGTYDYVCTLHPPGMLGRIVVG